MALEDKDLKQLAALLGDVLAPRIREAVAANVATRVEALAVRLQGDHKASLDTAIAAMRDAIGAAVKEVRDEVQEVSTAVGTLKYGTAQQLAEVEQRVAGRIDGSITELRELRSTASNLDGIITATQARMVEGLAEVKASIPEVPPLPEIPAPTKLVEGGELSEPMRVAMDLAVRQVFAPALRAALVPLDEQLASHANLIETNARLAGAARVALEENVKTFYTETNKNISIVAHSVESAQEKAASEIDTLAKVVGAFEKDIAGIEKDIDGVESRLTEKLETAAATTVSTQAQIQGDCLAKFAALNDTVSNSAKHAETAVNELAKVVAGVEQRRVELGELVNGCIKSHSELAESLVRVNVRAEAANERANVVHEELKSEVDIVANAVRDKFAEAEDIVKKVSTRLNGARSTIDEVHDRVEKLVERVETVNGDSKLAVARLETHVVEMGDITLARFSTLNESQQRLVGDRFVSVDASMQALRNELKELAEHEAQAESGTTRAINDVQTALSAQGCDIGTRVDEVVLSVRTAQAAAMQHADSTADALRQELVVLETQQRQTAESDTEVHASLRAQVEQVAKIIDGNAEFVGGVNTRLSAALQGLADEVKAFNGTMAEDLKRHGEAVSAIATSNVTNAAGLEAVKDRQAELLASLEASDKLLGEIQQASKAMADQQATLQGFIETVSKGLDVAGARIAEVDSAATVRARAAVQGAEQAVADAVRELTVRIDDSVTALSGDINSNAQRADEADKVVQDFAVRRMDEALVPITETHAGLVTTMGAHDSRFNALETDVTGVKTALEALESSVYTAANIDTTVAKFDAAHKALHDEVGRLQTAHIEIEARAVSTAESKAVDAVAVLSGSLLAQAHKHAAEALDAAMPALKDVVRSFNTEYVPALVQGCVDKQIGPLTVALVPHAEAAARQAASAIVDSYTAALHDQTAEVATRVAADACGEAVGAAKAAAEAIAAGALAQVEPLARSVAVDAVPAAVQQCTVELSANTAQIAEEVARGVAEVVSKVGAEAAAQAARTVASEVADDFVDAALAQVKASTAVMEAALFDRVKEAVVPIVLESMKLETVKATAEHATFLEQKLSVALIERVQREVDRIPRPRDGEDGKPGKDARVVTPVPYEVDKFYEHGAWVTHKGGTWVAARGTKVEPAVDTDWDCVAPGVASVDAALQDDGRTFVVRTALSDGTTSENQFKLPLLIQRDVYKDDREYDENDMVTYDGGQWIAKSSGKLPRPGTDKSWRLMVKAGRNGKDGVAAPARERFRGEWKLDTLYEEGEIVRHAGVGWFCNKQTRERPPFSTLTSNDIWTKMGS